LDQPDRLTTSALLSLALVDARAGRNATAAARTTALAEVVREAVGELGAESRERQVLDAVFLRGGGKHEKIAADLGLPYSTFRRYLSRGLDRVAEILRLREHLARDERHTSTNVAADQR
jgi:DNA-directed RNA polymerase specialized sigma24 family protein